MRRPTGVQLARRRLVQALAASGLIGALERNVALALTASDYKALVCIYQQGGNDGENTLVRFDTRGYANYAAIRTPASGLSIAQRDLLPIQAAHGAPAFGFHPACTAMKALFDRADLAVIANVGMLAGPSTRAGLENGRYPRPANLFSHSDQQFALQSADPAARRATGWGGRIADKLVAFNTGTRLPPVASTHGIRTFTVGETSIPLSLPAIPRFTLFNTGPGQHHYDAVRDVAMREILAQPSRNAYQRAAKDYAELGLSASAVINPIFQNPASIVPHFFAGLQSSIALQLITVALLIEGRERTHLRRQLFYVNHAGYDTHAAQLPNQHRLLDELSTALGAFQAAMNALGTAHSVTAFTLSDFGRTLKPASASGTDHGWGNYAFVIGGAVRGGAIHGTLPAPILDGPDDLGRDGRWIPSTSLEQYGAALARWMGTAEADLGYVFPNIAAFPAAPLALMRGT